MNESSTMQGHYENIHPIPHQLKWIQTTAIYQGKNRNSTIDQLKSNMQTNSHFEVLTNLGTTIKWWGNMVAGTASHLPP